MILKNYRNLIGVLLFLVSCGGEPVEFSSPQPGFPTPTHTEVPTPTPLPTRPIYKAGELVSYIAQTGDTLRGLAGHFNTSVEEIFEANPIIPQSATTLPPGLPMEIPIYYRTFWGTPYQILPDSYYINGPMAIGFDTSAFVAQNPGWLKYFNE